MESSILPLVEWTTQVYTHLLDKYGIFYDRHCRKYDFPMIYWWDRGKSPEETAHAIISLVNNYSSEDPYIRDLAKLRNVPLNRL